MRKNKKWTTEQDDFLKFMKHAGQSWDEISDDFKKVLKIKRTRSSLINRFYKIQRENISSKIHDKG